MRFKQSFAAALAAAAGIVTSVGLPATTAQAAITAVPLPITNYSHMLVDTAHKHLFIASGSGSSTILVTDYAGQTVATIPNEPGAAGLALSGDGSTVYAALTNGDAVSAISTSTLAETARYSTGTGTDPTYIAYTSGRIWFGYGAATQGGIGSIDPSTSPTTVTLNAVNAAVNSWYAAPMLSATPGGELVAGEPGQSPVQLASYDVSSGTAKVLAPEKFMISPEADNLGSLQVTPDGKDVVTASGYPYQHQVFRLSDLSLVGTYPTTNYPNSVSISGDGSVAAGTFSSDEIFVFAPGGNTPLNTYNLGANWLETDGVALTPDGSELFAVTMAGGYGGQLTLNIIPGPEQTPSTLSLTGPTLAVPGQPITLSGALGGASAYIGGQRLHVIRIDKAHPGGVTLPDVTTAADGSFSFTNIPPRGTFGTVTYQVSYAGASHLGPSAASVSVTIGL
jgi:hypothetical protein